MGSTGDRGESKHNTKSKLLSAKSDRSVILPSTKSMFVIPWILLFSREGEYISFEYLNLFFNYRNFIGQCFNNAKA